MSAAAAAAGTDKAQVEGWLVGQEGTRLELPPIDGNHPPANQRPTPNSLSEDMSPFEVDRIPHSNPILFKSKTPSPLARHPRLPNYVSGRLSIFKPKITMEREREGDIRG